jgi:hypothetical protein
MAAKTDYAASFGDVPYFESDIGPTTLAGAETYRWLHSGPAFVLIAKNNFKSQSPTGHSGVIYQRSEIKFSQITDGTTYTYLLGEKNLNPDHYEDCLVGNDDQSMYNGHDRDNLRSSLVWRVGFENVGQPRWPPRPDTPGLEHTWGFGGPHPGGWVALFCDGSVQFLPYDMDYFIHQNFGNRLDGNVIDRGRL